jgi:DNA-binding MarR family transcriptional regulator
LVADQLEYLKITMMEWLLLGVVGEGPDEGMSLSEIAKRLDVSQPQVTALMAKVSQQKLVKTKIQRHDRRSRHVILSARGTRMLEHTEAAIAEKMDDWLSEIPSDQLQHYVDTVRYISEQSPPS